jgi:hypothetical protein
MNPQAVFAIRRALFHSTSLNQANARVPLIKFIGKRSLLSPKTHASSAPVAPQIVAPVAKSSGLAINLPPSYGRPPLTAEEIEHIESGGASLIF